MPRSWSDIPVIGCFFSLQIFSSWTTSHDFVLGFNFTLFSNFSSEYRLTILFVYLMNFID